MKSLTALTPRKPWQRFQWRLTLLYLVASILTSVLLNLVAAIWLVYVLVYSPAILDEITASLQEGGTEAAAFFALNKVDTPGLAKWLDRQNIEIGDGNIGFLQTDQPADSATVAITDKNGVILASTPAHSLFTPGATIDTLLSPEERKLLADARRGKTQTRRSGARFLAAGPVLKQGGIVGYGFLRTGPDFSLGAVARRFTALLLAGTLYTAVGAAVIGGIFGYGTARFVTRRLQRISSAADRWASGDLHATAPESPPDEFGLLGRRLNGMASDLDQVLLLRRKIAALEERQSLARDLHDTVKQQAFAGAMMIGAAQLRLESGDVSGARTSLAEAATLAQRVQTDLAGILSNRRAEPTEDLPVLLERITSEWTRRSGTEIYFENRITGAVFAEETSLQVARIAEEGIANAVKHSRCAQVRLTLERQGDRIQLTVKDDGIGFDPGAEECSGIGLSTMRERAALLPDGKIDIFGRLGAGTSVIVTFSGQS